MKVGVIDVGGTNIVYGIFSDWALMEKEKVSTEAEKGKDSLIAKLVDITTSLSKKGAERIGIGMPGLVDHKSGIVEVPPNIPGWIKEDLKSILEKEAKIPVYILNDANAYALGEWKFGAGKGKKDIVLITLGTGVGGGIITGGRLLLGKNHGAAEVGHIVIDPDGPQCRCGQRGCLEAYIGNKYMKERASYMKIKYPESLLHNFDELSPYVIAECARKGDRLAQKLWQEFGYHLGLGIVTFIHIFDPEMIILGGGVLGAFDLFIDSLMDVVESRVMNFRRRNVQIVKASLEEAPLYGAYYFAKVEGNVEDSGD